MSNHSEPTNKIYPTSSSEVAKMLGLDATVVDNGHEDQDAHGSDEALAHNNGNHSVEREGHEKLVSEIADHESESSGKNVGGLKKLFKTLFPYVLVFTVGLVAYYFFFSSTSLNLSNIFKVKPKETIAPLTIKDTALMQLMQDSGNMKRYEKWIAQFYFDVSDKAILDPNTDNSGNGLTNFQKFLLNLNPKSYDSLNLGMADSESIISGINPHTGGKLTDEQQEIIEKYFDPEIISNRLAVASLGQQGSVAGLNTTSNVYNSFGTDRVENSTAPREAARSGNIVAGQNGNTVSRNAVLNNNPSGRSNSAAGGYDSDNPEIRSGDLNTETAGRLEIPSLNINVPVIWTKNTKNFDKDLQTGVVHYPGTALPGQIGTTYISGHSSNYIWAKGNYNNVFAKLGDLADNSSFIVTVVQKNGKDARFHYVVTHRKEFSPTDQEQFRNAGDSVVALSTCWPVGSTKSRLVVFGKLTQIEK